MIRIVSYPKSGRTWLRILLGKYLADRVGASEPEFGNIEELSLRAGLPTVSFTHDGSDLRKKLPTSDLDPDKSAYRDCRVLLLTRGVADTMVSAYFQATRRKHLFDGSLSEFLESDRFGVVKLVTFLEQWYRAADSPRAFLRASYEALHVGAVATLTDVLCFLGVDAPAPEDVAAAVEYGRFENMRRMEERDAVSSRWLRPGDPDDPESFKTRRGKVGGFRDYLEPEDIAYIRAATLASTCPWVRETPV